MRGIHWSPVNSPQKGQWRGALMLSLICVWTDGWLNNRDAGDMRRYRAHYDVTVMSSQSLSVRHHDIKTLSESLAWCEWNLRVSGGLPSWKSSYTGFEVFPVTSQKEPLKRQPSCRWIGMPWRSRDIIVANMLLQQTKSTRELLCVVAMVLIIHAVIIAGNTARCHYNTVTRYCTNTTNPISKLRLRYRAHERHPYLAPTGELWVYFVSYLEKSGREISGAHCTVNIFQITPNRHTIAPPRGMFFFEFEVWSMWYLRDCIVVLNIVSYLTAMLGRPIVVR